MWPLPSLLTSDDRSTLSFHIGLLICLLTPSIFPLPPAPDAAAQMNVPPPGQSFPHPASKTPAIPRCWPLQIRFDPLAWHSRSPPRQPLLSSHPATSPASSLKDVHFRDSWPLLILVPQLRLPFPHFPAMKSSPFLEPYDCNSSSSGKPFSFIHQSP